MPRLHPREALVSSAENDLRIALFAWADQHPDLTSAEYLKIVLGISNETVQSLLKAEIRLERHGNADTPGGLE